MTDSLSMFLAAIDSTIVTGAGLQVAKTILIVFMAVFALAIIVVIMMQKGTSDNIGVVGGVSDTYYGRNKSQSKESRLKKVTFVLFALILVTAIVYFIINMVNPIVA